MAFVFGSGKYHKPIGSVFNDLIYGGMAGYGGLKIGKSGHPFFAQQIYGFTVGAVSNTISTAMNNGIGVK